MGHAVRLCGSVVMRICSCTDMRVCRRADTRLGDTAIGHMALWCTTTRHLAVGCCSRILTVRHRVLVSGFVIPISFGH